MSEARLVESESGGLIPEGEGWFVLNAKDARWLSGELGAYVPWEGRDGARFSQLGINLNVLQPGEAMTMYHRENAQEDFLVLDGECVLIVEGEERPLRRWDLFHCPAGVAHAVVGAGDGPSLVLAVGARTGSEDDHTVYPADPAAVRWNAGVAEDTDSPAEAYKQFTFEWGPYREGLLPES
jgi:uncharacterized cupin superfamily protein